MTSDFDKWLFDATHESHQRGDPPLVTRVLYVACDHDRDKFAVALQAMREAFDAGREVGQEDIRAVEIEYTTRGVALN
jgi:hypothetical protein